MAPTKSNITYDDSLIISRFQQKELSAFKPGGMRLQAISPLTKVVLDPFLDQLPIKIGLDLRLLGSRIITCFIERGFMFENLEHQLSELSSKDALRAMAQLNQRTPIFYQIAYCQAMEELFDITVDQMTKDARSFVMEFSRIFHHWHVIKDILTVIGRDGMLDLAITAVNLMKDIHERLGRLTPRVSFVTKVITNREIKEIIELTESLAKELDSYLSFDPSMRQSLRKKAVITLSLASSFGLTGSFLRANRNFYDKRPGSAGYRSAPKTELAEGGDAWARFNIRIREILASLEWLKEHPLLKQDRLFEQTLINDNHEFKTKHMVQSLAFGEIDSPEGDAKVSIFLEATTKKLIYRVRTPAYFIAQALPHLLSQAEIHDLPLILYSLGISAEEIDR